jgi:uncharacterized membrane protein YdjX (TVP38/TMEM64 family)
VRRFDGLFLYGVAVAAVLLGCYAFPVSNDVLLHELSAIEATAQENILLSSLMFFVISAVLTYLAFPSMPLVYVSAGYCLDSLWGTIVVILGGAFGGLGAFLLYRKHIPQRLSASPRQRFSLKLWLALLGLRLSPVVPAPLVTFFAAFFNASPAQYVTTTIIGSAPLILFYGIVGQQGHNYRYGEPIHWSVFLGYLAILVVSTILSSLGPWRSFLNSVKTLKEEFFASRQNAGADCPPAITILPFPD